MQAKTSSEAVDHIIKELGIVVDDIDTIGDKIKKIAGDGTITAYKAYQEIDKMIKILFTNGKALEKYNLLDYAFYGVDKHHQLLLPDFRKVFQTICS